jgi:hypothetical protein
MYIWMRKCLDYSLRHHSYFSLYPLMMKPTAYLRYFKSLLTHGSILPNYIQLLNISSHVLPALCHSFRKERLERPSFPFDGDL